MCCERRASQASGLFLSQTMDVMSSVTEGLRRYMAATRAARAARPATARPRESPAGTSCPGPCALHLDLAAMLLQDAVADRQPKPRALVLAGAGLVLVVKNGSKMRCRCSGSMPGRSLAPRPRHAARRVGTSEAVIRPFARSHAWRPSRSASGSGRPAAACPGCPVSAEAWRSSPSQPECVRS